MALGKQKNKKIAVLGYGSQGRALALNLRDSGYDVTIGLKSRSSSRRIAKADRFKMITTTANAVKNEKLILIALPDHLQGRIYDREIKPNLQPGSTLVFLHGFAIHFGFIKPIKECDILLMAPHAPGVAVREKYLSDHSISAFYSIEQNQTGKGLQTLFDLAKSCGFSKNKLVKTTFEHEALGDLFGEQAVLCGGLTELIMAGYKTLTKNGIPPEHAYLEVAYQLDLIIELIKKHGIEGMYNRISVAAKYGSVTAGKKIIDRSVQKRMELLFDNIKSGQFANKLNRLTDKDLSKTNDKISKFIDPRFEKAAKKYSK